MSDVAFLRLLLRNTWLAAAAVVALVIVLNIAAGNFTAFAVGGVITTLVMLWVMLRFGILAGTTYWLSGNLASWAPLTPDLSAWYASEGLIIVGLILALSSGASATRLADGSVE